MVIFTGLVLRQICVEHIDGPNERKGSPAPDRLREMERSLLRVLGDGWPGVEPRQPVKARDRVRRFKRRAHRAAPDLQRRLDRPRRDPADELRERPGTGNRRGPTAGKAQEDCTIDLIALHGGGFGRKRHEAYRDDRGS
jgi:hypothetical protein